MNSATAFLADIIFTAFVCVAIVAYVRKHLRALLIELCGTAERASFWLAFSNVVLVLMPLIFALQYKPELGPNASAVFEVAGQLKYALVGFVTTLVGLAVILLRFVPHTKPNP